MENQELPQYEFVNKDGRLVRSTEEGLKPVGIAYGLIGHSAPIRQVEAELQEVSEDTRHPSMLELSLREDLDDIKDLDLREIARKVNPRYVVKATYLEATNEKTAEELAALLINTSQSLFCMTDEHMGFQVVYKEGRKPVLCDGRIKWA